MNIYIYYILSALERDGFDTKHPLFICYVATVDQQVIGYALAYYTYSTWGGRAMYLEDLYITPNFRRKHIGIKLLKTIAKVCVIKLIYLEYIQVIILFHYKEDINMTIMKS